ncbi:MAG TPA: hypothetical protein VMW67_08340 [Desulfobacteria bacterium]|nr:hypothetical protein [Desulfobacteria bacterium]
MGGDKAEEKTERKATSIKIDPKLWKAAKIEAIERGIELSELVEKALRKELGEDM